MDKTILEQLNAKKIKVSVIANELKVTRGAVYNSINGLGSRDIRIVIATILNKKPSELWHDNNENVTVLDDALYLKKHKPLLLITAKVIKKAGEL
jgi:hypothetical protein